MNDWKFWLKMWFILFVMTISINAAFDYFKGGNKVERASTIENFAAGCTGIAMATMYKNNLGFESVEVICQNGE